MNFRINPTVQQGGAQTMQQAIYLSHKSSCGINLLVYQPLAYQGTSEIGTFDYNNLRQILEACMQQTNVDDIWLQIRLASTAYLVGIGSTLQAELLLTLWGQTIYNNLSQVLPVERIRGSFYRIVIFDGSGNTLWDSNLPQLQIITFDDEQNPLYTTLPLTQPNPLGKTSISLYGIGSYPWIIPYIEPEYRSQLLISEFMVNQMTYPESEMCIASLLTDPANTRTFGFPKYGFSSRTVNPERNENNLIAVSYSYNCAYYTDLLSVQLPGISLTDINLNNKIMTSIGIRLSIETLNSSFGYQPFG